MIRRRCGESIFVGEDIEIQVLEVTGNRVKLGIVAPRQMLVLRNELKLTEDFNREASRRVPAANVTSLAANLVARSYPKRGRPVQTEPPVVVPGPVAAFQVE